MKLHPQAVPFIGGDLHVRTLFLGPSAINRMVDGYVVLERVGSGDVVIVRVLGAPDNPAGLVFLPGNRLELHFHRTVLDARIVLQADGIGRHSRLLQDV